MSRKLLVVCYLGSSGFPMRHRWKTAVGVMSTPGHVYFEERCRRCRVYRSEVYA